MFAYVLDVTVDHLDQCSMLRIVITLHCLCLFSQTTGPTGTKLSRNITRLVVLNILHGFHLIWKFNMAARANFAF